MDIMEHISTLHFYSDKNSNQHYTLPSWPFISCVCVSALRLKKAELTLIQCHERCQSYNDS